ncbi:MAG: ribokinase [Ktedonobacterales bacterium]
MRNVIVLGSLMMDLMARAPRLPMPGESLLGDEFGAYIGGKGCNQAVAARRMGADVALIGRVGDDDFGRAFLAALASEGVDHTHVSRDKRAGTGVSCVHIGAQSGQNAIIATPRANFTLTSAMVEDALQTLLTGGSAPDRRPVFLTQCEIATDTVASGLRLAHAAGCYTIFNVAPIPRHPLPRSVFALVDLLVVNETEAAALTNAPVASLAEAQHAATLLLALGPRAALITLGARGSLWHGDFAGERHTIETPTHPVTPVDATGAGDAFCGALACAFAEALPLRDALHMASAAGALAVTRMGAVPALPTRAAVDALTQGANRPGV